MGMLATIKAYRALSPQQKQLLEAKQVEGDYRPDEWLRLLGGLAAFDSGSDRLRKWSGTLAILSLVLIGIGIAVLPLLPFGLLLLAAAGPVWFITRRMDLDNRMRVFVLPLIDLLGDDVKRGRALQMKLDLRDGMDKEKRTEKLPPYRKGAYHKVVETRYEDPWLQWDTVLSDGAHLQLQIHDSIRELKCSKRTARGKHKTKTKYKIRRRVNVRLRLPVEHYRVGNLVSDRRTGLQMKSEEGEKWLSVHARRTTAAREVEDPSLESLLELLTRLYKGVERIPEEEASHA